MKTIAGLEAYALEHISKEAVKDLIIGLGYIFIELESGLAGVAGTPLASIKNGCTIYNGPVPFENPSTDSYIKLIGSKAPVSAAVGLATINAHCNRMSGDTETGDILSFLEIKNTDMVAMVGDFAPIVRKINKICRKLFVFEQIEAKRSYLLPSSEIPSIMPSCDIAIISATTLANHTIDSILPYTCNCREVAVLGPSTPLIPRVFVHTPVTLLSGVIVTDPQGLADVVKTGGGMQRFKQHVLKVTLKLKK